MHLHKAVQREDEEKCVILPGVTIAKPLSDLSDPNLVDNLASFFTLNYPTVSVCISPVP